MAQVSLSKLVAAARSGALVSFPTDTVPALAVLPEQSELIFAAKQRSGDKPLILMGASLEALWSYVSGSAAEQEIWQQVADRYWPGALTLVLPASDRVPPAIDPRHTNTIGLRVPNHDVALKILAQTGPLATTSANLSGQPPLQTVVEISAQFPQVLTLLPSELESSKSGLGVPSTVAKWTGSQWEILRQGAVKLDT